jgi:putative holliday junction resolvase
MARYLGIDFGSKRMGLAYADELGVATPLPAVRAEGNKAKLSGIGQVIQERRIEALVIGYPLNMNGSTGFKAREVDDFIGLLEKKFGLPVHRADERLSTQQVEDDFRAFGKKTKRDRNTRRSGEIDSAAAALILRGFLESMIPPENSLLFPEEPPIE